MTYWTYRLTLLMTYNLSYSQIAEQVYNIGILVYTDVAADHNNSFTCPFLKVNVEPYECDIGSILCEVLFRLASTHARSIQIHG